jgi:hypothetical protein
MALKEITMFDFNSQKFVQDTTKLFNDAVKAMPKTPEQVKDTFEKMGRVVQTEATETAKMIQTYQRAVTGEATANEITAANKKAQELATATAFAGFMSLPGTFFLLPAVLDLAKKNNVELVLSSVKKEFDL